MKYFSSANKKNKHPYLSSHSCFPELCPGVWGLVMFLSTDVSTCKSTGISSSHQNLLPFPSSLFSPFPLRTCPSLVPELWTAPCPLLHPGSWQWLPQLLIAHSPLYPWGHLVPCILPLPTLSCLGPPICYFPSFAARCHFKNAKFLSCKHFQGLSTYLLLYSQDLAYCFHILGTWVLVK